MNNEQDDLGLLAHTGYDIGNFDVNDIQEEEIILMAIASDTSGSVHPFEKELNNGFAGLIEGLQKSHVAPKIMMKAIGFDDKIDEKTGFMPVMNVNPARDFNYIANGSATAIYAAAKKAIEACVEYRTQLESTGINVKVLVIVITDGDDNYSPHLGVHAKDVANMLDNIKKDEKNVYSFQTILFGIGNDPSLFNKAKDDMHFGNLAVVGTTTAEIKRMIGFISTSVSRSHSNQAVAF